MIARTAIYTMIAATELPSAEPGILFWGAVAIVALAPAVLYLRTAVRNWETLKEPPTRPEEAHEYNTDASTALTLAGFTFTALTLVATLRTDELARVASPAVTAIFGLFGVALGEFVATHVLLRVRATKGQLFASEGLLDHGLWCTILGFGLFCHFTPALGIVGYVFAGVAIFVIGHLVYALRQQERVWH